MTRKPTKAAEVVPLTTRKCPACGKPQVHDYRPFCSKRCADRDLGRWLNEEYRVATNEAPDGFPPPPDEDDG